MDSLRNSGLSIQRCVVSPARAEGSNAVAAGEGLVSKEACRSWFMPDCPRRSFIATLPRGE